MRERRFPTDFRWGAATASYQIEGAIEADGRGESIWDRFSHTPGHILGGDTGDVACDHYQRYRDDAAVVAELGLDAYRFSIAWPRVVPAGRGPVNEAGLDFYDRLVDALLEHGVEPFATLYHWDLPQALEDAGGWPARSTALAFAEYAAVVARRLGDRVASIATMNEPQCAAEMGYGTGEHAPGRTEPEAVAAAAHHLLLGHGLAVQAIRAHAPATPVGLVLNYEALSPATSHPLDLEATELAHERFNRWYLDPVTDRGYPPGALQARGWDRAEVLDGDMAIIAAPLDFMGVNYYTARAIRSPLLEAIDQDGPGEVTGMGWNVRPGGLREVLGFVKSRTAETPLYVTENGAAYPLDRADATRDPQRVSYIRRHLAAVLDAIDDGVPVKGYFVWSLLDNFEWAFGYAHRFGVVHVDFETQERRIRDSGRFMAEMARTGVLVDEGSGNGAAPTTLTTTAT